MSKLAIIGGTGVGNLTGSEKTGERVVETPYGSPSAPLNYINIGDQELIFLARHGLNHHILPHEINYRANIYALKNVGVTHIISISAVGSLKEKIAPGDFVLVDQFFDRTSRRADTFFGDGCVVHIPFAEPTCHKLGDIINRAADGVGICVHKPGTYVNIDGPSFSTRAESDYYRKILNADIIGMTNITEAKLAREAEICYAVIAQVTDYDCWRTDKERISVSEILKKAKQNSEEIEKILLSITNFLPLPEECECRSALSDAFVTPGELIPEATKKRLNPIINKYIK